MEIADPGAKYKNAIAFKIDLIVWKFYCSKQSLKPFRGFKIDLIVWKFRFNSNGDILDDKFKIDLIVWKLYSRLQSKV